MSSKYCHKLKNKAVYFFIDIIREVKEITFERGAQLINKFIILLHCQLLFKNRSDFPISIKFARQLTNDVLMHYTLTFSLLIPKYPLHASLIQKPINGWKEFLRKSNHYSTRSQFLFVKIRGRNQLAAQACGNYVQFSLNCCPLKNSIQWWPLNWP